ncbi:MAG: YihA family ribosome biogenesis GTP-binding protein [Ruminococcaceae bacterium]|nr:YihA family ribosome biogenesis GTP-binding protein [Oscillospiraceae bacterium]
MDINNVKFEMSCGISSQLPESSLPEVVFSGRSNVGKSSLINKITNRKNLARVSATPGKTATINFFSLKDFMLVDLPGYGYAKVSPTEKERWAELVEGYFAADRNFALVIQICDIRHKPIADDLQMINFLSELGFPFVVVLTKKDKLNKSELAKQLQYYSELLADYNTEFVAFSALNGDGVEDVRAIIDKYLERGE